jgi:transcriptional regulator with XRE-family HTH domain
MVLTKLGENVRMLREQRHISQERLALEADLDRTYISQVERGKRNVSIMNVCRLAHVLKVTPSALLEGVEWPISRTTKLRLRGMAPAGYTDHR